MIETFQRDYQSGKTIYAVFWKLGVYYDWTDNAWETPSAGSDSQAVQALTETALDGNAVSVYTSAALDMTSLENTLTKSDIVVRFYLQAGGSPDLTTDTMLADLNEGFEVCAGHKNPTIDVRHIPGHRKDESPKVATFTIEIIIDGVPFDVNELAATLPDCVVTVYKEGQAAAFFTETLAAPTAAGQYYVERSTPGYVDDRTYRVHINIGSGDLLRVFHFYGAA
tara:strand:- start:4194 stop:4865 length:672 start_codon:yes stop_codon:yes gene_type:complete